MILECNKGSDLTNAVKRDYMTQYDSVFLNHITMFHINVF